MVYDVSSVAFGTLLQLGEFLKEILGQNPVISEEGMFGHRE